MLYPTYKKQTKADKSWQNPAYAGRQECYYHALPNRKPHGDVSDLERS
jgi:hypothetical protein